MLAQVEIRERSGDSCIARNEFCPGWIVDNFDRYTNPARRARRPDRHRGGIGFAIAFTLALLARRRRWLVGPIVGITGVLYTLPSLAVFFLLLPITGPRHDHGPDRAHRLHAPDHLPQHHHRPRQRPAGRAGRRSRDGLTDRQLLWRVELPLAVPDIIAGLRIASTTTVGLATLAVFAGAGGLGEQIVTGSNITFKTGVVAAGGLAVLLALALDVVLLAVQRVMTPWRRAQPA